MLFVKAMRFQCLQFHVIHSIAQGEEEEEEGLRSVDSGPTQAGKKGALLDLRSFFCHS